MYEIMQTRRTFLASIVLSISFAGCGKPSLIKPEQQKRLHLTQKRCIDALETMKEPDKYAAQVAFKVIGDVVSIVEQTIKNLPKERKSDYKASLLEWRKKVNRLGVFSVEAKETPAYFQALNDALVQSTLLLNAFIKMK